MEVRLVKGLDCDSIVDGPGIRTVVWFQGCTHNCFGCHNPESFAMDGGILFDVEEIKNEIRNLEMQDGITLSGGDPFFQPNAMLEILKFSRECGLNTWAYSGFLYDDILKMSIKNPVYLDILKNLDVLVDGKFVLEKKSFDVKFRGSTNQRLIDVKESLKSKKVVEYN